RSPPAGRRAPGPSRTPRADWRSALRTGQSGLTLETSSAPGAPYRPEATLFMAWTGSPPAPCPAACAARADRRPPSSPTTSAGAEQLTPRRYRFGIGLERSTFEFSASRKRGRMTTPSGGGQATRAPFNPTPVMRPVDQVRLSIVQAIASGRLRPGDRLPSEHEQARGFKVSRASVREALRSLVEMGLVTTVRGRGGGSFVNRADAEPVARNLGEAMDVLLHIDAINVAELLEARRSLEGTCARLAAERRSEAHLHAIEAVLDEARDDALEDDPWLALDVRFHREVAESAENRVLMVPLAALHATV